MEVIFSKREVYIHEKQNDAATGASSDDSLTKIGGQLQIVKNVNIKKSQKTL